MIFPLSSAPDDISLISEGNQWFIVFGAGCEKISYCFSVSICEWDSSLFVYLKPLFNFVILLMNCYLDLKHWPFHGKSLKPFKLKGIIIIHIITAKVCVFFCLFCLNLSTDHNDKHFIRNTEKYLNRVPFIQNKNVRVNERERSHGQMLVIFINVIDKQKV